MLFDSKRKARRPGRPALELLERREVPATFHASNIAQLQADLAAVNNSSGPNTIILAPGNYPVPSQLQITNAGNLVIQGTTKNGITTELVGNNQGRVFQINGGNVTLSNVTIAGGGNVARGGGIAAQNTNLTIKNSLIINNTATQAGAGIAFQGGNLLVTNSWLGNNGVFGSSNTFGGALAASNAQVTVNQTLVTNNSAVAKNLSAQAQPISATGGAIYTSNGSLTITAATFSNNFTSAVTSAASATSSGGAVGSSNTTVSLTKSRVQNNDVNASAHQVNTQQGIAFYTNGGTLTVTNSVFGGKAFPAWYLFSHPNATVTVKNSKINGSQLKGTYTLGDKGMTAQT